MSASAPLSISFYVPPPTPTPAPPCRPAFLTAPAVKGVDVLPLLRSQAASTAQQGEGEAEAKAALLNLGCEAKELLEVLRAVEKYTKMACFRALLLEDGMTLLLLLEGGLRFLLALHGSLPASASASASASSSAEPGANANVKPVLCSSGWSSASARSPSRSPERARGGGGDSGVAFGGSFTGAKGGREEQALSWAIFEPSHSSSTSAKPRLGGRGRALFRAT